MPSHNHTIESTSQGEESFYALYNVKGYQLGSKSTSRVGSNGSHGHGVTDATHTHTVNTSGVTSLPPWYSLIYCVKVA